MRESLMFISAGKLDHICSMKEEYATVYFRKFCEDNFELYGEQLLNSRQNAVKLKERFYIFTESGIFGGGGLHRLHEV